jgi:hypothetical protein
MRQLGCDSNQSEATEEVQGSIDFLGDPLGEERGGEGVLFKTLFERLFPNPKIRL